MARTGRAFPSHQSPRPRALQASASLIQVSAQLTGTATLAAAATSKVHASASLVATATVSARAFPVSTTGLVAYWPLQEASGPRLDAHGANDLTENGTVGQAAGPGDVFPHAADFDGQTANFLSIADNPDLSAGDIPFEITGWCRLETKGLNRLAVGKEFGREYVIAFDNAADRLSFVVFDGTSTGVLLASNFGPVPLDTWLFFDCWHDSVANTLNISINGTVTSRSWSTGTQDSVGPLSIGGRDPSLPAPWDGQIAGVTLWKRLLTPTERIAMQGMGIPPTQASATLTGTATISASAESYGRASSQLVATASVTASAEVNLVQHKFMWRKGATNIEEKALHQATGYMVITAEGWSIAGIDHINVRGPRQDGATYLASYYQPRSWSLQLVVTGSTIAEYEMRQRELARLFNPKSPGTLRVTTEDGQRYDLAARNVGIEVRRRSPITAETLAQFISDDPFWRATAESVTSFDTGLGMSGPTLPFSLPITLTSEGNAVDLSIENGGHIEVFPVISINGPTTSPTTLRSLTQETDLAVAVSLLAGESLTIDFGRRTATKVTPSGSSSVFSAVTGQWWTLGPGLNLLRVVGGGALPVTGTLRFTPRYVAVL